MVLICFVVDTSASMNQKTIQGMTLLDSAKAAIEHFVKIRSRDQASRADRYFLVTCDESMGAIKANFIYFILFDLLEFNLGFFFLLLWFWLFCYFIIFFFLCLCVIFLSLIFILCYMWFYYYIILRLFMYIYIYKN